MSRLLNALDEAQQQRMGNADEPAADGSPKVEGSVRKPRRIGARLLWLLLLSGLLVGAYALAQQQLDGEDPLQWLRKHLSGF